MALIRIVKCPVCGEPYVDDPTKYENLVDCPKCVNKAFKNMKHKEEKQNEK
jgi:predicted  nucleic acid-binding Zn-ribbon protein